MPARERQTFPLVPRRRLVGLPFGDLPSRRRGHGSDVIGTRPYEIGDPVSTIDWFATARLSSAVAARADVASLDFAEDEPYWLPPGRRDTPWLIYDRQEAASFRADEDNLEQALAFLGRLHSDLPTGSFVFVLSDFLVPPHADAWLDAAAHGWDVVPVVIQDPVWEQSFPEVGGVVVPIADPRAGVAQLVRLTRREAEKRRHNHEARLQALLSELVSLDLEPVLLGTSDPHEVDRAFVQWAEVRRQSRWAR